MRWVGGARRRGDGLEAAGLRRVRLRGEWNAGGLRRRAVGPGVGAASRAWPGADGDTAARPGVVDGGARHRVACVGVLRVLVTRRVARRVRHAPVSLAEVPTAACPRRACWRRAGALREADRLAVARVAGDVRTALAVVLPRFERGVPARSWGAPKRRCQ